MTQAGGLTRASRGAMEACATVRRGERPRRRWSPERGGGQEAARAVFSRRGRFFLLSIVTLSDILSYLRTRGSVSRVLALKK